MANAKLSAILLFPAALLVGAGLALAPPAAGDVPVQGPETLAAVNALSVTSGAEAIAANSGNRLAVKGLQISSDTSAVIEFRDGSASGTVIGAFYAVADTPYSIGSDILGPGLLTASGNALYIKQASGTVTATIRYRLEH